VLVGSGGIGQIAALVVSPFLTRLYTPADFGMLAIYMSLTAIVGVVVCLRYELAVVLPESDTEALNVTALAWGFALLTSLIGLIVIANTRHQIAAFFNLPMFIDYLWFFPLTMLLFGLFRASSYWAMRKKNFGALGKARLQQVFSSLAVQLGGAAAGPIALIGGQLANQGVGSIALTKRVLAHREVQHISIAGMIKAARRYRRFPLISSWSAILNRTSAQLPALIFAALFGPVTAGLYALATRVVQGPATVLIGAIQKVFLSAAADAKREQKLAGLTASTHAKLAGLCLPPLMLLATIAPQLFSIVFGEQWREAGYFAQWITLSVYCAITVSPLMNLFAVLEKQGHEFVFQICLFFIRICMIGIGWWFDSPLISIACYSIGSLFYYGAFFVWLTYQINVEIWALCKPIVSSAIFAAMMCVPTWFSLLATDQILLQLIGLSLSTLMVAGFALNKVKAVYR